MGGEQPRTASVASTLPLSPPPASQAKESRANPKHRSCAAHHATLRISCDGGFGILIWCRLHSGAAQRTSIAGGVLRIFSIPFLINGY